MFPDIVNITQYLRGFGFSDWAILAIVFGFLAWRFGLVDRLLKAMPWLGMLWSVRQQAKIEQAVDTREHTQSLEASQIEHKQMTDLLTAQNETYLMQATVDSAQQSQEFIQSLATTQLTRIEANQLEIMRNLLEVLRRLPKDKSKDQ